MTTSLHHSKMTDRGVESVYFSNGDNTGWKTFLYEIEAINSAKVQGWLCSKGVAPKVLSEVMEIELIGKIIVNPYSFHCPVSGVRLRYLGNNELEFFNHEASRYEYANCLEPLKEVKAKIWGYLTEEVPIIARELDSDEEVEYKDELEMKLEEIGMEGQMDLHPGNWGLLNDKPVVLDCGRHFIDESDSCNPELYKLVYGHKRESEDDYDC